MKKLLLSTLLLFGICSFGQSPAEAAKESIKNSALRIEFQALLSPVAGHTSLGISYRTAGCLEHNLSAASTAHLFFGGSFKLALSYNLNTYIKGSKNYIPIWTKVANTRRQVGYEEGYFPHTLRFSLGTGFGRLFSFGNNLGLRTEIGVGALINLTNGSGKIFTLDLDLQDYAFDPYYPQYNPKVLPSLNAKVALVYTFNKK